MTDGGGLRHRHGVLAFGYPVLIPPALTEDGARPIIFYPGSGACWQPQFHGHQMMVNGNYNGWRLEDAWLDK
jgi:hypothetical protein